MQRIEINGRAISAHKGDNGFYTVMMTNPIIGYNYRTRAQAVKNYFRFIAEAIGSKELKEYNEFNRN